MKRVTAAVRGLRTVQRRAEASFTRLQDDVPHRHSESSRVSAILWPSGVGGECEGERIAPDVTRRQRQRGLPLGFRNHAFVKRAPVCGDDEFRGRLHRARNLEANR
jgi:hypothetical protein